MEASSQLQNAIRALPPKFMSVVALRYKEMRFSEIAKELGMPEATAKTYFYRARKLLKETLSNEYYN